MAGADFSQLLAQVAPQAYAVYKRCNCKKAKCLKLYCVCFAAGAAAGQETPQQ
jgi:hypothetical protein